ncbi:MAG: class I SAM-dependent methyltransferase, partial [Rudaea sp.]
MSTNEQLKSPARRGPRGNAWSAAIYDFCQPRSEGKLVARLREAILGDATGRVVEIGIGTGASLPYYHKADKIVGVDPDPAWMRRAQKRAEDLGLDVELHHGMAEALPFPESSFDT